MPLPPITASAVTGGLDAVTCENAAWIQPLADFQAMKLMQRNCVHLQLATPHEQVVTPDPIHA